MLSRRLLGSLFCGALALPALAATQPPPNNLIVKVDGVEVPGVVGYSIQFSRQPIPKTDSRRLDLSYSPDERRLILTVNQNGLKALQDWLNLSTDGGTPTARVVTLTARNLSEEVLVTWEVSGVMPWTLSQATAGQITDITATLEFLFDRMRLVDASAK